MTKRRHPFRTIWEDQLSTGISLSRENSFRAVPDIAANIRSTATALLNQNFVSQIDRSGDVDWIRVQFQANTAYKIYLDGQDSNAGTLSDPLIRGIYDSRGRFLGASFTDDDSGYGRNSYMTFTPTVSGTYFIATAGYGSARGTYSLLVSHDQTPPELVGASFGPDSSSVALNANIELTFSEEIHVGSGVIQLISDREGSLQIDVTDTTQVVVSGQTMTINPSGPLTAGASYQLVIGPNAILDSAGNAYVSDAQNLQVFQTVAVQQNDNPVPDSSDPVALKQWTIMVYLAADNDLETYALQDINEMESIIGPGHLGVTALLDRHSGYSTDSGNWSDTRMANIVSDSSSSLLSFSNSSGVESDTGSGQTLTEFILWSIEHQPAENYALVIWDHGGGIDGIAWDESSNSYLSVAEVSQAVAAAINYSNTDSFSHFDVLAMDACLMGMVEVAHPLVGLADYFVASQELVPGEGFAYDDWLDVFQNDANVAAQELVNESLSSYVNEYAFDSDITISALDMSQMNDLVQAMNQFTNLAMGASARDLRAITKVVAGARDYPSDQSYDFADLGHAMNLIASNRSITNGALKSAAQQVSLCVDDLVMGELGTVNLASGVSIYLPYGNERVSSSYNAQSFSFLEAVPLWDDFLRVI